MQALWRHPTLPIGILLLALGIGNTFVSAGKVEEYARRLAGAAALESPTDLADLDHLTPRTNETLLRRLHRGSAHASVAAAKRDFYALVNDGGRLIALAGLLLALFGVRALLLEAPPRGAERRS